MHSTMYGKIEKASRYAQEPDRIVFHDFQVTLEGDHREHLVSYDHGAWSCDCETLGQHGYCPHTMAMERVLGSMLREMPATAAVP
jgi:hypothetical protein